MLFKIITLFIFLSASELKCSETQSWIKSGYWYSGSAFPVPDINSALFTHLICAFARINYSSYELSFPPSEEPYVSTFTDIVKRKNPSVTTLLSIWVGDEIGDENSTNFFSMISQSDHRKSFIESSIRTARLFGFQGLDLWCYVLTSAGTNMTNLGTLFDDWRAAINAESINSTRSTLSLIITGRYSPASKLVLGLAFHGYAWTLVNPKDNQIGAPARGLAITADGSMNC